MNLQLIWDNLVAYSMQIGLLVGLAAFIPSALRLRLPASRLAYWHILLAACLLAAGTPSMEAGRHHALRLRARAHHHACDFRRSRRPPHSLPPRSRLFYWPPAC